MFCYFQRLGQLDEARGVVRDVVMESDRMSGDPVCTEGQDVVVGAPGAPGDSNPVNKLEHPILVKFRLETKQNTKRNKTTKSNETKRNKITKRNETTKQNEM